MHKRTLWLTAIVLAFSPTVACADAGTPLMIAGTVHLLFGNAIIGVAEGLILAFLFKRSAMRCIAIMIVANYFSAWVGGVFLISQIPETLSLDLYNVWWWLWCMVAVSYCITLLLEWPFVALCVSKSKGWALKTIWGSLLVQSASYLVLFGWYWAASGTAFYTLLAVVGPAEISYPKDAMLYYIADSDGDVYAQDLGQGEPRKICELKSSELGARLFLWESRESPGCWDLAAGETDTPNFSSAKMVIAGMKCVVAEPPSVGLCPDNMVPRFRADTSGWTFWFTSMWGRLVGGNTQDGRELYVTLETPFVRGPVYYATQLPSGQIVLQLGENQICVLDPNERKIALIAKGRWPVVTMKDRQQ